MEEQLNQLKELAKDRKKANKKYFRQLKRLKTRQLDDIFHELHDTVFEEIDCLDCANCCKTTSPMFFSRDIERLAKHLRMRPAIFTEKYLKIDEDGDYVLQTAPCPFLGSDNYCSVYEARPKACREYPHTDRKQMHKILDLTLKNTAVCPAVFEIVERMKNVTF